MEVIGWRLRNPNAPVDRDALDALVVGIVAAWPADQVTIAGEVLVAEVQKAAAAAGFDAAKVSAVDVVSVLRDRGYVVEGA